MSALMKPLTETLMTKAAGNLASGEIEAALAAYAEAAKGAYAANTERARKADSEAWVSWCFSRGFSSLPATPETVVAFVGDMAASRAPATITRYLQTIAHMHKAAGLEPPTRALVVSLALRRMRDEKGVAQKQAAPLGVTAVRRILKTTREVLAPPPRHMPRVPDTPAQQREKFLAARDAALIALAYASAMRRSELVALDWEDFDLMGDEYGFGSVTIRHSKPDQEGRGQSRGVPPDVLRLLRSWRDLAPIAGDAVFVSPRGVRLDGRDVSNIIKRRAEAAGMNGAAFSGHSTRVGATIDRITAGETTEQIQRATGHKSPQMITRYGRNVAVRQDARRVFEKLGKIAD